jgi:ABC-type bacteriocin/lantibiotic exporter with double-glycine peptidase domain
MTVRQSTRAVQLLADALRLDIDPSAWLSLDAQVQTGPLSRQIQQMGQSVDIAFLTRQIEIGSVERAVADLEVPVVLVASEATTSGDLLVMAEDRPGRVALWLVPATGEARVLDARTPVSIAAEVRSRLGTSCFALSPLGLKPSAAPAELAEFNQPDGDAAAEAEAIAHGSHAVSRLWELLSRDKREILVVFFYAGLAGLFSLTLPLAIGGIVQLIQGGLILQSATILIAYVIVGTIIAGVLQVLQLGVVERIQQRVFARLALEYAFHLPRIRYDVSLREDLPETVNRLFEGALIQKSLAKFLLDTSQALLTIFFGLILLTFYHPYFTLVGVLLVLTLALLFWFTGPKGLATSLMESKYKYRAVHWLEEVARSFHAFKFAGRSQLALSRMDQILTKYLKYRNKHFRVLVQQAVSIVVFKTLITAGLLIVGTVLVVNRQITLGQFVASELVVVTVLAGVEKLVLSLSVVYDMLTSVEKAGHVTDLELDAVGRTAVPVTGQGMQLEARDLSYTYGELKEPVLRTVSLTITPGQRVALTGFKGAGRSTLLRLLSGLFDDYSGTLLVDNVSMHEVDRESMRERVGQVLSLTDLFEGTIAENISVGRSHIGDAEVWEALRLVGLQEEVQAMRDGLQTRITNGGRSLPSHLATKLLFAQGIAGSPRLVLFDDLFMNLLADDRRRLLSILSDPSRQWTVIAVSHDPVLLEAFDRVLVIRAGDIAADGSFASVQQDPYCQGLLDAHERTGELARSVRLRSAAEGSA